MEHGFEATSLRSITAAAGVNLAAVNYHFGSKEELFEAVLTRRLDPMNQERARPARRDSSTRRRPTRCRCERILSAMFIPALRLARDPERGGKNFLRLLGRAYADPAPFIRQFLSEQYAVMIARFKAAFGRALPQLPQQGAVVAAALHHGRAVLHAGRHRRAEDHRRAHAGASRTTTKCCCAASRRSCSRACSRRCPSLPTSARALDGELARIRAEAALRTGRPSIRPSQEPSMLTSLWLVVVLAGRARAVPTSTRRASSGASRSRPRSPSRGSRRRCRRWLDLRSPPRSCCSRSR